MLGETISITLNGVSTTLNRIREQDYSAEYFARTATFEMTMRVRHQREAVKANQPAFERHHVDLTYVVYDAINGDKTYQSYTVIRLQKGASPDTAEHTAAALCGFLSAANVDKIVGWQS